MTISFPAAAIPSARAAQILDGDVVDFQLKDGVRNTVAITVESSNVRTPIATTGKAKSVKTTSATLAGSVKSRGQDDDLPLRVREKHQVRSRHAGSQRGLGDLDEVALRSHRGPQAANTVFHYRIVARAPEAEAWDETWPSGPRAPVSIIHLRASPADAGAVGAYPKNVRASSR